MAGIGFVLRKLTRERSLSSTFRAYIHAALAAAGPWVITILTIAGITMLSYKLREKDELFEFRLLLIYNFSFSLVLASPVFVIATRYLADKLFLKKPKTAPGLIISVLALLYILLLPMVLGFYIFVADVNRAILIGVVGNVFSITALWLVSLFISIIEDFKTVTWGYFIGGAIAVVAAILLLKPYGTAGLLFGFNIGLCVTLGILISQILVEYNYEFVLPKHFFSYFRRYWQLALGALIYNIAAWSDKWIMWFSPYAEKGRNGLIFYDNYDSALFLSQLTIIPGMAMFLLSVETGFFEQCRKFYGDILGKVTYQQIERNHKDLISHLIDGARNIFILQGGISILVIFAAPSLFEFFNLNYLQMGIFRLGVLGALFNVMGLFIMVLLTYFDARKEPLIISAVFLVTNVTFTTFVMPFGLRFYGYGYFLSALVTFALAGIIFVRMVSNLPYLAFIKNNNSIREKVQ